MREDRNQASVRIEIDGAGGASAAPEAVPSGPSRLPLIGGLCAVVLVAVLVLLARPQTDGGIPGGVEEASEAETTTTTTSTTTPTIGPEAEEASVFQATDLLVDVRSIAPAARGWVSLDPRGGQTVPTLHRSVDGVEWTQIDATFELPESESASRHREFFELTATDDGFAMLLMEFDEGPTQNTTIHRLVSDFGAHWTVDAAFDSWSMANSSTQPIAHESEWVQMVSWNEPIGRSPSGLTDLLEATLIDSSRVEDSCWAYRAGDAITVEFCTGGDAPVRLVAEDFIEPEQFDDIATCIDDVTSGGPLPGSFAFTTVGIDGSRRELNEIGELLTAPILLSNGTVLLLDGGNERYVSGPCSGLLGFDELRPARLIVWPSDAAEPLHLKVQLDVFPDMFFAQVGTAAVVPGGVRMIVGTEVWHVDLESAVIEQLLPPLEQDAPDRFGPSPTLNVLTPDGSSLVRWADGEVLLIDLDSGEQLSLGVDPAHPDWIEPVLVTNNEVFVRLYGMSGRVALIDLTLR